MTRIDRCPVLIGKNVYLASFTFDVPSFHIEDLFSGMGLVSILNLNDKVYPSIVKEFYKKMTFSLGTDITCLFRNKRVKIIQELIRSILHLKDGGIRLYTTKTILHLEKYNPIEACRRVTGKHFETPARLSTNQLTLTCRVLHNIIAHIIVFRKGHLDEVNHYDVFLLNSILIGRKLDFSYIMLQHMNSVLSGTRPKALPYGMIFTKVFLHFEDGQWVAKSKGLDDESGSSTLPFEGGEEMDEDEDEPPSRPRSQRPLSSISGFTEDHFNLLNGRIDSLTSSVEGLHHTRKTYSIPWALYNNPWMG
ncbi:zf-RVT domain-containing protein [Abeliophyllum distichum]|uniref:Zf-RVT domain-containing protein n=1 Tax=Abeliophyllum distichum TaxID=126358 RepID=A0ABD1Q4K5_9LAMI